MLKNQRESLSTTESLLSENQNQMELYQTGPNQQKTRLKNSYIDINFLKSATRKLYPFKLGPAYGTYSKSVK